MRRSQLCEELKGRFSPGERRVKALGGKPALLKARRKVPDMKGQTIKEQMLRGRWEANNQ